jgi:hypothetical protein
MNEKVFWIGDVYLNMIIEYKIFANTYVRNLESNDR